MLRRRKSEERGAAAVEFALVTIPLLLLLAGIIQYSIYFWGFQVAANGAREGARAYAVDPCGDHTALVEDRVGGASSGTISVNANVPTDPEAGDFVTVTVSFPPQDVTGSFVPMPAAINQSATARIEDVEDC